MGVARSEVDRLRELATLPELSKRDSGKEADSCDSIFSGDMDCQCGGGVSRRLGRCQPTGWRSRVQSTDDLSACRKSSGSPAPAELRRIRTAAGPEPTDSAREPATVGLAGTYRRVSSFPAGRILRHRGGDGTVADTDHRERFEFVGVFRKSRDRLPSRFPSGLPRRDHNWLATNASP